MCVYVAQSKYSTLSVRCDNICMCTLKHTTNSLEGLDEFDTDEANLYMYLR